VIDWGDGTTTTLDSFNNPSAFSFVSGGTFQVIAPAHTYAEEGSYNISLTVTHDANSAVGAVQTDTITVNDTAVTVNANSGATLSAIDEGSATPASTVIGTFTDPGNPSGTTDADQTATQPEYKAVIDWGDGTTTTLDSFNNPTAFNFTGSGTFQVIAPVHTYAEDGSYNISLTVTHDANSAVGAVQTDSITVNEVPLTNIVATPPGGIVEGNNSGPLTVATFTDPAGVVLSGGSPAPGEYTATIDWGDGTGTHTGTVVSTGGNDFAIQDSSHTFPEEGTYTLTVTITHGTGATLTQTATYTVADQAVSGTGGFTINATEGATSAVQTVATFTDPAGAELTGGQPTTGEYTATIDWGDGTPTTTGTITYSGGTFTVTGSHLYAEEGNYNVSVLLQHGSAPSVTVNSTADVIDPLVTGLTVTPPSATEAIATAVNANIASFTDPAGAGDETPADFTATINWGDNSTTDTGTVVSDGNGNYHVEAPAHTYAEEGTYTVTVSVTHGQSTAVTLKQVTVADQQLTGVTVTPPSATEGSATAANFNIASFTDPAGVGVETAAGDFTATINWGDNSGTVSGTVVSDGNGNYHIVAPAHTYAEEGNYTVTVTVTHAQLPAVSVTASVSVADAALTAGALTPPAAVVGQPISNAVLFHFSDANPIATASDYTATVTWGDGSVENSTSNPSDVHVVADPNGGFDVIGSHSYTAVATGLTFQVAVQDKGGATTSASASINVLHNVVVAGTPGNDRFVVSFGAGANSITYTLNGGSPVVLTSLNSITFNGRGGNNTLVVVLDPSDPLPSNIHFNGGKGSNTLVVDGSRTSSTVFTSQPAGTSPFAAGEITGAPEGANQITGRQVVTYSSVQTVRINYATTINGVAGPRTIPRAVVFNGLNPQERAVQALYLDALGRAGTKAELDIWTAALPPGATSLTQAVVSAINNSPEARDHLVKSWYISYLGRQAQGGEEQVWVNQLQAGQSEVQVLSNLLSQSEFYSRAQLLISSGTADQRYVEALYQLLLNRPANANELATGVANVAKLGRGGYALSILQGQEYRADQIQGYYDALLHLQAGSTGLDNWVASNLDLGVIRIDFEDSPKFFTNG
jgi:PKD repeat protein